MRPLAVVGNLSLDRVDGGKPRAGGAPFWAARALRLLGARALLAVKCADADRALLARPLVALGLPVLWLGGTSTAGFSIRYDGDRREMTVDGIGDTWTPEDVSGLGDARWAHVGALAQSDFPAETLSALARGRQVSFGEPDEPALRSLGVPEVVVTLGSRGSLVLADGRLARVATQPVAGNVDPTGAGDAFAVAYLAARAGGHAPVASARRAGALVAGLLGGRLR